MKRAKRMKKAGKVEEEEEEDEDFGGGGRERRGTSLVESRLGE